MSEFPVKTKFVGASRIITQEMMLFAIDPDVLTKEVVRQLAGMLAEAQQKLEPGMIIFQNIFSYEDDPDQNELKIRLEYVACPVNEYVDWVMSMTE
jgi:hypothetical protein